MNLFDLQGRTVVVTGGGGHLGAPLSLGLAAAGANVVIIGRTATSLDAVVARDARVLAITADVTVPADVARVVEEVVDRFGALDGWVNNAYAGGSSLLGALELADAQRSIEFGLVAVISAVDIVSKRMALLGGGSIVNIASMYGMVSPQPQAYATTPQFHNPPAYGAAKAGVLQLTRYAACHLAPSIRVNAVSPGPFPRPSVAANEVFAAELSARVPLGRLGRPEELVGPVQFLLSDASSFLTGQNIVVDGGWTAW